MALVFNYLTGQWENSPDGMIPGMGNLMDPPPVTRRPAYEAARGTVSPPGVIPNSLMGAGPPSLPTNVVPQSMMGAPAPQPRIPGDFGDVGPGPGMPPSMPQPSPPALPGRGNLASPPLPASSWAPSPPAAPQMPTVEAPTGAMRARPPGYLGVNPIVNDPQASSSGPAGAYLRTNSPLYGPQPNVASAAPPKAPTGADSVWQNMLMAESRRNQFDKTGRPLTSPAGAVGIAQVLPSTGKATAASMGLPWDESRFYTDPAYNEQIGRGYFDQMLTKYSGNTTLAAAAYNAGPGRVDQWLKLIGDPRTGNISDAAWAAAIPTHETHEYVAKVMGGGQQVAQANTGTMTDASPSDGGSPPAPGGGAPASPGGGAPTSPQHASPLYDRFVSMLNDPNAFPTKPTTSEMMMALASGMLDQQGRFNPGGGFKNLLDLQMGYRHNTLEGLKAGAELEGTQARIRDLDAHLGIDNRHLDLETKNAERQGQYQQDELKIRNAEVKERAVRDDAYMKALGGRSSGEQTANQEFVKANSKEATAIADRGEAARNTMETLQPLTQLIEAGQGNPGPDAFNTAKRWIANRLGMQVGDSTPSGQQLAQTLSTAEATGKLGERMRGLGLRTQREFNMFRQGLPGLDSANKDALLTLYGLTSRRAQFDMNTANEWLKPDTDRRSLTMQPQGVDAWVADRENSYLKTIGIDPSGQQPPQPALQQNPSTGGWSMTTGGTKFKVLP